MQGLAVGDRVYFRGNDRMARLGGEPISCVAGTHCSHVVRTAGGSHGVARLPDGADPETAAVLMIGEIGGTAEEDAAAFVRSHVSKPVVGFICGQTAPPGRRMGHAGAIISGGTGTAAEKMAAMRKAGITVVKSPAEMGQAVARLLPPEPVRRKIARPAPRTAVTRKSTPKAKPSKGRAAKAARSR